MRTVGKGRHDQGGIGLDFSIPFKRSILLFELGLAWEVLGIISTLSARFSLVTLVGPGQSMAERT